MDRKHDDAFTPEDLDASLVRLGIRELEERLEVSPLLAVAGDGLPADETPSICCSCKFPEDFLQDGSLPYPTIDVGPTTSGPLGGTW